MIGYLGPAGTFAHQALRKMTAAEAVPLPTVAQALDAVRRGQVRAALVPIENSVEGGVSATLDNLANGERLMIVGEVLLPITFCLAARPGVGWDGIRSITSHPHAVAQTRDWVAAQVPQAVLNDAAASTAAAAKEVASSDSPHQAAICARVAAELYGLEILADDVHDTEAAVTRFVLVTRPTSPPPPTGADKTTLVAYLSADRAGALLEILEQFSGRGVNLCRIESRPTKEGFGSYCFSIDADGHLRDPRMAEALQGLHRVCRSVVFLGSYARADGVVPSVDPVFADAAYREAKDWFGSLVHPED